MKFINGLLTNYNKRFKLDLIPKTNKTSRPQYTMKPEWITVHNTANPGASAEANSNYVDHTSKYVSWHFTIGNGIVIQELPIDEVAWHCGDGSKGKGNRTSIGIEIAEVDGAYETAVVFIKDLVEHLGFTTDQVVPHKKWSGKNCPRLILPKWEVFMKELNDVGEDIASHCIAGIPTTSVPQMKQWARDRGAHPMFVELAPMYYRIAVKEGCDPAVVYAQSAKETGFMRFGGVIDITYCNPCGMKVGAGGGNYDPGAHMKFRNWEEGITAQIHHLLLYAGAEGYPRADTPDPRHFPFIKGKAPSVELLSGKWAPSKTYGFSIVNDYIEPMLKTLLPEINYEEMHNDLRMKADAIKDICKTM